MEDIATSANNILSRGGVKLGGLTKNITKGIKSVTGPVEKLLGVKGPIYTIGYIAREFKSDTPNWLVNNGLTRGLYQAITNVGDSAASLRDRTTGLALQNGTTIDGFFSFSGNMEVSLPSYPIQLGSDINMQRVRKPDTLSMEIFISSHKSDDILERSARVITDDGLTSLITGKSGGQARIERKLNELRWLNQSGRPFRLYTPHCIYENMVLARIKPTNDEQTMDGWSGTLDFKEIIYYSDAKDTTSRKSKKELSNASKSIIQKFSQVL